MAISPVQSTSIAGIRQGLSRVSENVSQIAQANGSESASTADLARALVELSDNVNYVQANVRTFKTANDILGTLLDLKG